MSVAIQDVLAERQRQKDVEGWTPEHDDKHGRGEMALAAATYSIYSMAGDLPEPMPDTPSKKYSLLMHADSVWPWDAEWKKTKSRRRNLVRAAALLIAELERLDRAAACQVEQHICSNCDEQKACREEGCRNK